jgi:hypothetical protein
VNAALAPALFQLRPPAGARVVDLDRGGPPPPEDLLRSEGAPAGDR